MTVTAEISGEEVGGPPSGMAWAIRYDDATRAVTATAAGAGWCFITVQITPSVSRTVAFYPAATGLTVESRNPDFAGMATADFRVVADGSTATLASGINPNQVSRIVGKPGQVVGGLPVSGPGWAPRQLVAIAFGANLGTTSSQGTTTTNLTTSAAAASGTKIFALVSWFNSNAVTMTVSGGSLTWTSLKQVNNGSDRFAIWSADAPTGLASGSTIAVTQSNSGAGGLLVGLVSWTGLATGTTVDTTNQATGTGASWSSGAATNTTTDALFIGGAGNETTASTTSTPTAGTEIHDVWFTTAGQGFATGYTIAASAASRSITGTWVGGTSTANTGALVVFPAAAGATVSLPELVMAPNRGAR